MIARLAALFLLGAESLICAADVPAPVSVTVVKPGDDVNVTCPVSGDKEVFYMFKQTPGRVLRTVVSRLLKGKENEQFTDARLTFKKVDSRYFLTIANVSKEDEATYFCQTGTSYRPTFVSGTYLAVNDENQQERVYLELKPEKVSGKGHRVPCPGGDGVFLFRGGSRSGSGLSHPDFLYVHRNRSEEDKGCVYTLSDDDGTYHCSSCLIPFGEGTDVKTSSGNLSEARSDLDPTVPVLGVLLACCVAVIVALVFFVIRHQRNACKHCKGAASVSHHRENDRSRLEVWNNVDAESGAVNYAVLDFPARKVRRVKEKREAQSECLYSAVETSR